MPINDLFPTGVRSLFDPSLYSGNPSSNVDPSQFNDPSAPPSDSVSSVSQGPGDNISQITQALLAKLNQPDPNLDRLNQLYNSFPTRTEPSVLRKILGGLVGISGGPQAAADFVNKPYNQQVGDWALKNKAAENIANTDIKKQHDDLIDTVRGIQTEVSNQKMLNDFSIKEQSLKQSLDKANNELGLAYDKLQANRDNVDLQNQYHNLALKQKDAEFQLTLLEHQREALSREAASQARIRELENNNAQAGWDTLNIPDPADPTKMIPVRVNKRTGQTSRITLYAQNITGPAQRLGTGGGAGAGKDPNALTEQTKTMMQGAQMLYPHIDELRQQAAALERRGLFGPIMSRVAELGSKIGTVGDPGDVQKSFEQFGDAVTKDPQLMKTNDAAVGQFLTTLGLTASGAGKVHGGARGGGSIQMINYMKTLLGSNATLPMFMGRLNALDSFMKQYAAGPPKPKTPTKLDGIINKILGAE